MITVTDHRHIFCCSMLLRHTQRSVVCSVITYAELWENLIQRHAKYPAANHAAFGPHNAFDPSQYILHAEISHLVTHPIETDRAFWSHCHDAHSAN
jgi:hypothetical protein